MTLNWQDLAARADTPAFTFIKPPPVVGYWHFPGSTAACTTRLSVASKPSRLHRWTMRILLGFKWEDA